jgi:uncharacterized membrane protein
LQNTDPALKTDFFIYGQIRQNRLRIVSSVVSANPYTVRMTIVMVEMKRMNQNSKITIIVAIIAVSAIVLGIAVANACYAATQPTSPYGQVGYGASPYVQPAPSNGYSPYGTQAPYGSGYGYYGGMGGMGRMGMMR